VTYGPGENVGCLGTCHATDLRPEHKKWFDLGEMEGNPASFCRACHDNPDDPGTGAYADLPAVAAALANNDRRCVACHMSASGVDGPVGVAAPPSGTCTATVVSTVVTADPLETFKAALARSVADLVTVSPARADAPRSRDASGAADGPEPSEETALTDEPVATEADGAVVEEPSGESSATPEPEAGDGPDTPSGQSEPEDDNDTEGTDGTVEEDPADPECERTEDATSVAAELEAPAIVDARICLQCHEITE
jgi:hypothetical protein